MICGNVLAFGNFVKNSFLVISLPNNNINGLVSEIKDYEDLANNVMILVKNPILKTKFAEKSYSIILNKFTDKQLVENTLSVYNDVLNKKAQ